MPKDGPLIGFENVSKRIGGVAALDGVTLAVAAGEFLAVVGRSGAGKSSLLGLVNRLAEPSAGTVRFEGEDVRRLDPIALRRTIGYVFQEIGLFPHMTVADNIAITPRLIGWEAERVRARIDDMLRLVRLAPENFRDRLPRDLSGGQAQRVGIARALAAEPRVMLMDEPFGALDPLTREAVARDYRAVHDKLGLTTLMITHDITEALVTADRIAVMEGGRLIEAGTPREMMRDARDAQVRELMAAPRRQAERLRALDGSGSP